MNLFFFFLAFCTFTISVHGMHPDFRRKIQTFYEGDFRTVMALYNRYTENNDTQLVNPCDRYSEMMVLLDPQEFTSIESDVIISLNTNMALTLDGNSYFSIPAVMKCAVKKDDREVFKFFVLLLPEWAKCFSLKNLDFVPVYSCGSADKNWEWFALKDVYDFQVMKKTFTDNPRIRIEFLQSVHNSRHLAVIDDTMKKIEENNAVVLNWTHHFDDFLLLLDEKREVQIPGLIVIKYRNREDFIDYMYMIIFDDNSDLDDSPNPFRYPPDSKKVFPYLMYNTGKRVNGMWAFCLDFNLVNPKTNIFLNPSFIDKIRW